MSGVVYRSDGDYAAHRRAWREEFLVWRDTRDLPGSPDTRLAASALCSETPRNAADELLLGGAP